MGGWGRFLKGNFLSYAENPDVYQRADRVQQKTQLPDQRQLIKLSSSQLQYTCPKASASPSLPSDKHWHESQLAFSRTHKSRSAFAPQRPRPPELEQCERTHSASFLSPIINYCYLVSLKDANYKLLIKKKSFTVWRKLMRSYYFWWQIYQQRKW